MLLLQWIYGFGSGFPFSHRRAVALLPWGTHKHKHTQTCDEDGWLLRWMAPLNCFLSAVLAAVFTMSCFMVTKRIDRFDRKRCKKKFVCIGVCVRGRKESVEKQRKIGSAKEPLGNHLSTIIVYGGYLQSLIIVIMSKVFHKPCMCGKIPSKLVNNPLPTVCSMSEPEVWHTHESLIALC